MGAIRWDGRILQVVLAGSLPALIVAFGLFVFRNIFIAMFLMHWIGMVPVAVALSMYNRGRKGLDFYWEYLRQQQFSSDLFALMLLWTAGFGFTIAVYAADSCKTYSWALCVGQVDGNMGQYGFNEFPRWFVIVCAGYFSIVNPFIEEMFWRVFMIAETAPPESSCEKRTNTDEEAGLVRNGPDGPPVVEDPYPLDTAILFGMLYASYHTLVVGALLGAWTYALVSFVTLSGLGVSFHWLIHAYDPAKGFYRAVFLHAGIDLGIVIALADSVGWIHLV